MEDVDEWWLLTVYISVFILMLIVMTIRDYRAKRNLPRKPEDKRINRKFALDNLKFILGIREKVDSDNPMKERIEDDDFI